MIICMYGRGISPPILCYLKNLKKFQKTLANGKYLWYNASAWSVPYSKAKNSHVSVM